MRILIIRHGIAEEMPPGARGKDDALRELTRAGRQKMRRAAKGLRRVLPPVDLIATSPLTRAAQTADILAKGLGGPRVVHVGALSPRKPPAQLIEWLNAHSPEATLALVGHEPHLGTFLCWLLTGLQESFVSLKKGGAALIETPGPVTAGRGRLLWLLKPAQARKLQ